MAPVKLNLTIYQGATFEEPLRWESGTKVYKPITAITNTAPVVITAVAHGIPVGWRAKVTNVSGMKELVSADEYRVVTAVTADTVEFNAVNAIGYTPYVSGGILEYNEPVDLLGYTARMQIRGKITDTEVILELNTENNRIVIDNASKTITITISAADTALLSFTSAVYSLELINSAGRVIPLLTGTVSLKQEVTR